MTASPLAIKLIGLGGVGGIVARYLTVYLSAVDWPSRLVFIDGDVYTPENAARMVFSRCGNKAAVLRDDLIGAARDSGVTLTAIEEYVSAENLPRLVHDGDVVLLCVDNHATRKLVSDFCGTLEEVVLISGGNDGVGKDPSGAELRGTFGNVQIYRRAGDRDGTPSLAAFHPEIAEPADAAPDDVSCTDALVSVPQLLFTNLAAASAILNAFWLHLTDELHYAELCFDIRDGLMRPIPLG